MKLKKFRTLEDKINLGLKIFCCLLILTIVLMGKSFAEYKQEVEVPFIRARVGKFKTNDIQLAMLLDGEEVETPPSKDNYTVDISCDNADGSWDSDRWLAEIGNITAGKVKCEVNFITPAPTLTEVTAKPFTTNIELTYTASGIGTNIICKYGIEENNYVNTVEGATNSNCSITGLEKGVTYYYQVCAVNGGGEVCKTGSAKTYPLSEQVKIGDYISMTPTSTSYIISKDLTGYSEDQKINPSELTLWRVIRKNEDGSVDAVSEYVSSVRIYFSGRTGYKNYVGVLNLISSQFDDGVNVIRTRTVGYSNRKPEFCSVSPSWSDTGACSGDNNSEFSDLNLINKSIGRVWALRYGETYGENYWLGHRNLVLDASNYSYATGYMVFRNTGETEWKVGRVNTLYDFNSKNTVREYTGYGHYRPVVTFNSSTGILRGDGSNKSPYKLS